MGLHNHTELGAMARILVIDDEVPLRQNLTRFLQMEGHEVTEASDGEAGLTAARLQAPQLIFCDLMMPRMNGMELLNVLRGDPTLQQIPFIFLSASAEPEKLETGMQRGAVGYLTKPFRLAQLSEVLRQHL